MSTIGGSFNETQLLQQRVKASEILFDDRIKQQFVPQFEVLKAIQAIQTATIGSSFQRQKKYDVEIMWENFCDIVAKDCDDSCDLGGEKSSTNTETKTIECFKEVGFSMSEADFIDNEYDMNVAKALLAADKSLVEAFAAYAVAQMEAFKGTNVMGTSGKGTISGGDTAIIPAYWTASLFAYLNRVSIMNKFSNPILLSGNNLYEANYTAMMNAGNANGKGDANFFGSMPLYFDLFNIDTVNDPDFKTYMLSMGSMAMVSKTFNPAVPEKLQDFTRYTMNSNFFPALKYDVWYDNACESGNQRLVKHNYTLRLTAAIFGNPSGCSLDNTGVLAFKCA
jgi:hypothetical protein